MRKKIVWKNWIWIPVTVLALLLVLGLVSLAGESGDKAKREAGRTAHLLGATYMSRSNPFFDVLH